MGWCLTLGLQLVCVICALAQTPQQNVPELNQRCLDCICQASSNCDVGPRCHTVEDDQFCGPYIISYAYWHDGGRPWDNGHTKDFENCVNNKTCAEEAVRGYMRKYGQDCDNNGAIDCNDFARIHKMGFSSCGGTAIRDTEYWKRFKTCFTGSTPIYDRADGFPAGTSSTGGTPRYDTNDGFSAETSTPSYDTNDGFSAETSTPSYDTNDGFLAETSTPKYDTNDGFPAETNSVNDRPRYDRNDGFPAETDNNEATTVRNDVFPTNRNDSFPEEEYEYPDELLS